MIKSYISDISGHIQSLSKFSIVQDSQTGFLKQLKKIKNLDYIASDDSYNVVASKSLNVYILVQKSALHVKFNINTQSSLKLFVYNDSCDLNLGFNLKGNLSKVEVYLVNFFQKERVNDIDITFNHLANETQSQVLAKNVSFKKKKTKLEAKVRTAPSIKNSLASLKLKSLVSSHSNIESNPVLEILSKDVSCSHENTISYFEDKEINYLLSKGLELKTVQELLTIGFLDEVKAKLI
ncbi:MAG: SufD family Fe-S cluster assembly protein [Patescibacteria group bacterium]